MALLENDVQTILDSNDFTVNTGSGVVVYPKTNDDPPIAAGVVLVVFRDTDITQLSDLTNQGGAWPETIETSLDKLTQIAQEQGEALERSVKVSISSDENPEELMTNLYKKAAEATTSASAAAISETNAGNSATAASVSAGAAANSKTRAEEILADIEAAAETVGGAATVYDPNKQYEKANQVMVENGDTYRCIEPSLGEYPPLSSNWVLTATGKKDTFERDENGDLVPVKYAQASDFWGIDENGDIYPRHTI
ncbi:hypothetical protein [Anaerovibrio lipolyticus]|uniref:hypothetical protein n=1 Tax=Anaerovibrio lipolyticus TaxID=82374 RepID=UPI0013563F9A|nr:hypothetical protein [Anaerovibrio lipolyticus]